MGTLSPTISPASQDAHLTDRTHSHMDGTAWLFTIAQHHSRRYRFVGQQQVQDPIAEPDEYGSGA
jgi:hypothetical protein